MEPSTKLLKLSIGKDAPPFSIEECIICQKQSDSTITSNENGRKKILEAAYVRDIVYVRWQLVEVTFITMNVIL